MAQACNNIGKELSSTSSSTYSTTSKQRKSNSPSEGRKSLKRSALPTSSTSPLPPAKKLAFSSSSSIPSTNQQSVYFPPSPFIFESLFLHHLSKTFSTSPFFSTTTTSSSSSSSPSPSPSPFEHSLNSAFTPSSTSQRSTYFMDSILAPINPFPPAFVCNWMESSIPDGFCGKRFTNHISLLEHLCTAHTSLSSIKSLYPTSNFSSFYSPTSVGKL